MTASDPSMMFTPLPMLENVFWFVNFLLIFDNEICTDVHGTKHWGEN